MYSDSLKYLCDFLIYSLACFQIVRVWITGSLFEELQERLKNPRRGRQNFLEQLLTCPFCFSVWIGFLLSFFWLLGKPEQYQTSQDHIHWAVWFCSRIFIYGMALSGVSWFLWKAAEKIEGE